MAITRRKVVFGVLAVALVASLWRTVSLQRQQNDLTKVYEAAQQSLAQLEQQRVELDAELGTARTTMEGQGEELASLREELDDVRVRLAQTSSALSSLQQAHTSVVTELSVVKAQKQELEAKLSSIKELTLAIHDIRGKMWQQRWAAWRARAQAQRERDRELLASGNRGFVVRAGTSTLGSSTKLHVRVLEPEPQ